MALQVHATRPDAPDQPAADRLGALYPDWSEHLVTIVANEGAEHELMESWLVQEVEKGAKLPGLCPPNEENNKRYEAWKKSR